MKIQEMFERKKRAYLGTGISALDKMYCFLSDGSLTGIAGRPGMGKTSLAFQIAGNIAKGGRRVLIFSTHMPEKLVRERLELQNAGVPEKTY